MKTYLPLIARVAHVPAWLSTLRVLGALVGARRARAVRVRVGRHGRRDGGQRRDSEDGELHDGRIDREYLDFCVYWDCLEMQVCVDATIKSGKSRNGLAFL